MGVSKDVPRTINIDKYRITDALFDFCKAIYMVTFGSPYIQRPLTYPFTYETKVKMVQKVADELTKRRVELQSSVDEATERGEEIYDDVKRWLNICEMAIEEVEELKHCKEEEAKKRCFNLKTRYQLSDAAINKVQELRSIKFDYPRPELVSQSIYFREKFESRLSILNQVVDALRDPEIKTVGVYGMVDVGKTTLANEVRKEASQYRLFDVIITVAVSQSPDVRRIENKIADVLGLSLDEGGMYQRATRPLEKKILIILDDVWKKLDLGLIRIPFQHDFENCKILLTTRDRTVLREMGVQKEFMLGVLTQEEAFRLFAMTVAHAEDPEFNAIADAIVKKCGGLPQLIHSVGMNLRDCKDLDLWKKKLKLLSEFENDDTYHQQLQESIELSYESLPDKEMKSFFLLCALLGQCNMKIQHLLRYLIGMDFFKPRTSVQSARDKIRSLIEQLQNYCLLLPGDMDGFDKMHLVVRNVAISIASRKEATFICPSGVQFSTSPNKNVTRIFLPHCDIQQLPQLECPKAELLILLTEDLGLKIPDSFCQGITKLKGLDFTGMRFGSLPSSLLLLTNLRTLSLHRCQLDKAAIIGELKQLQVLSFAGSYFVELPREIGQLSLLKVLDLSNCSKLKIIPANVLSNLSLLEELYMGNSFVKWKAMGINNQPNASLAELGSLSHLTTLELQVLDAESASEWDWSGLKTYRIFIGDDWDWSGQYETSRTIKLSLNVMTSIDKTCPGVCKLLKKSEDLYIGKLTGIESMLFDLDEEGFPKLKHLHLRNNHVIQHIINSKQSGSHPAFPILESLFVSNLMNLEKICHGPLAEGSFSKLSTLKVISCNKLKNLFSVSVARCLLLLVEIEVISCDHIEFIVVGETDGDEVVEFKELRTLTIEKLPRLTSFCSIKEPQEFQASKAASERELDTPLSLFTRKVSLPSLTSLLVSECHNLRYIFTTSFVRRLVQLKKIKIYNCDFVKEILVAEKSAEKQSAVIKNFPKLDSLYLELLPQLLRFCGKSDVVSTQAQKVDNDALQFHTSLFNDMVAFSNLESMHLSSMTTVRSAWQNLQRDPFIKLKSLHISHFDGLLTLFPRNVWQKLKRLETLTISSCSALQYVYEFQGSNLENNIFAEDFELRNLELNSLPSLKHIWDKDPHGVITFNNLQSVEVSSCEALKNVFPASIAQQLWRLEKLYLENCGLEEIVAKADRGEELEPPYFEFPRLASLRLSHLKKIMSFYPGTYTSHLPALKHLEVIGCFNVIRFGSEIFSHQEETDRESPIQQPLILAENISCNLEELAVESKDLKKMEQGHQFPVEQLFRQLKVLQLEDLQDKSFLSLSGLLERLTCFETLKVNGGSVKELFSHEGIVKGDEHVKILERLKNLKVSKVDDLKHIWKENSPLVSISEYLKTLEIMHCNSLMCIAPSSSSFRNLSTLEVSFCARLENLVTASTAKTMQQLTKMKIHSCNMITEIVWNGAGETENCEIIFNKLKTLELEKLPKLYSFCSTNHSFSFPSLEEVTVKECFLMETFTRGDSGTPKLRGVRLNFGDELQWEGKLNATIACQFTKSVGRYFVLSKSPELKESWRHGELLGLVFSNVEELTVDDYALSSIAISSQLLKYLNQLEKLEVKNSDSVQIVFDLEGLFGNEGHLGLLPRLSTLYLSNLPMLAHVWNKNPEGILDLKSLKFLDVQNCSNLKHPFTWSMARCLVQLEHMEMKDCFRMGAIINDVEPETVANDILFPALKCIVLERLPKLSSFYLGIGKLECPSLEKINIHDCPNLITFCSGVLHLPKLHHVHVTCSGRESHWDGDLSATIHQSYTKSVGTCLMLSQYPELKENWRYGAFPGWFFIGVEMLMVDNYALSPIVVSSKLLHHLNKLEILEVSDCESVQVVFDLEGLSANDDHLGLLPKLSTLYLRNLPLLSHIWNKKPQGILDLANLKLLGVQNCSSLKHLFTWSMAMCLVQLEEMEIKNCDMMEAIIVDEEEEAAVANDIIFPPIFPSLKSVVLEGLPELSCFHSGSGNLDFPSLENITLYDCPKILPNPSYDPILMKLRKEPEEDNFELRSIFKLSQHPEVEYVWPYNRFEAHHRLFHDVEKMIVDNLTYSEVAIPTQLLTYLKKLQVLKVMHCRPVLSIFSLDGQHVYREEHLPHLPQLMALEFLNLPGLDRIWVGFHRKILNLKILKLLHIKNLSGLHHVFPLSLCTSFVQLEVMEIINCPVMEEVIVDDEEIVEIPNGIIFPSLKSIVLSDLPMLSSFYSGSQNLRCPSLINIVVEDCPKIAMTDNKEAEKRPGKKDLNIQFPTSKMFPSAGELSLDNKCAAKILQSDGLSRSFFSEIKVIKLRLFLNESQLYLLGFLARFPNLEQLWINDSSVKQLIELKAQEDATKCLRIKALKLDNLGDLTHIWNQNSQQQGLIFQYLETMDVMSCPNLIGLAPSSASFPNLTILEVCECNGLINLVTSAVAKSMVQLVTLSLSSCKMLSEIVSAKQDGTSNDEIEFRKLKTLKLIDLHRIASFCSSDSCSFEFPSLEHMVVENCPNLWIFCSRFSSNQPTPKLNRVRLKNYGTDSHWDDDLNTTIQQLYMKMARCKRPQIVSPLGYRSI